jgi:thiol-disulfide isomerase/thioredoxin
MIRTSWPLFAGLVLALPAMGRADDRLGGTWKVTLLVSKQPTPWLVKLQSKDGKWTGKVVAHADDVGKTDLRDLSVGEQLVHFTLITPTQRIRFEGKIPREGAKAVLGSVVLRGEAIPARLEATTLESLDTFDVSKDILATHTDGPEVLEAACDLLEQATDKKAKPVDVRVWAKRALKSAEAYGPRLRQATALRVAESLADQDDFAATALEYAEQAERLLSAQDRPNVRKRVLQVLAAALEKVGKTDRAGEVAAAARKLAWVTPEKLAARKSASDRVVLVELFTGSECPPCVAADLAFDALAESTGPKEVVFLEYHLHIPGFDPLGSPGSAARQEYYGVDGTPAIFFNGDKREPAGGAAYLAQYRYDYYCAAAVHLLDTPAQAKLQAKAVRKGDKIDMSADVADVDKPDERKLRLRLALVEDRVDYKGSNKIPSFRQVVRALPGGARGFAVTKKADQFSASVDLGDLRKQLNRYLDESLEEDSTPPANKERPLDLKRLHVVAFVQDDDTKDILQAVQVKVQE